jgi:hypothetical protein
MRFSLVLLVLAACGGGGTSTQTTTPPTNTTGPTTTETAPPAVVENDNSICANRPEEFGPIVLDAAQGARRRGRDVTKFSALKTSKEKPLEVCGIGQQQQWLMTATCDDGSRPYRDRNEIRDSRRGNVGAGGTCGTIIDLYVATCPEAAYEVHIDMYHCGPGESFM